MAWLSGYSYRKKITITGQEGAGTNYQVKLLIGKASGATGENFDLEGHCLDTMLDIRFTDNDETTQIDYWIESVVASGTSYLATVWVEVRDTLESNADIYIYYGKADDAGNSNGTNTFIQYHGAANANYQDASVVPPNNIAYETKFRRTTSGTHNLGVNLYDAVANDYLTFQSYSTGDKRYAYTGNNGATTTLSESPAFTYNVYVRLVCTSLPTVAHFYVDGDEIAAGSTTNLPDNNLGLGMWLATGTGDQLFSFARKWVVTEPAYSSAGTEEGIPSVTDKFFLLF